MIDDTKFSASNFDQLLYSHVKRECISIAYCLVRYVIDIPDFFNVNKGCSTTIFICTSG